jgi:hypothetical protein
MSDQPPNFDYEGDPEWDELPFIPPEHHPIVFEGDFGDISDMSSYGPSEPYTPADSSIDEEFDLLTLNIPTAYDWEENSDTDTVIIHWDDETDSDTETVAE